MNPQQQAYIEGFVKRAAAYGIDEKSSLQLLKQAKLDVRDIESVLDTYLHEPSIYEDASAQIDKANQSSLGLKHPILTGIPTLGLWPAMAKHRASGEIVDNLLRKHESLRRAYKEVQDDKHRKEVELMPLKTEELKGRNTSRNIATTGLLLSNLMQQHHNNKQDEPTRRRNRFHDEYF